MIVHIPNVINLHIVEQLVNAAQLMHIYVAVGRTFVDMNMLLEGFFVLICIDCFVFHVCCRLRILYGRVHMYFLLVKKCAVVQIRLSDNKWMLGRQFNL